MWWLELFLVLKGRMWMVDRFVDVFEGGVDEELKWLPKWEGGVKVLKDFFPKLAQRLLTSDFPFSYHIL